MAILEVSRKRALKQLIREHQKIKGTKPVARSCHKLPLQSWSNIHGERICVDFCWKSELFLNSHRLFTNNCSAYSASQVTRKESLSLDESTIVELVLSARTHWSGPVALFCFARTQTSQNSCFSGLKCSPTGDFSGQV